MKSAFQYSRFIFIALMLGFVTNVLSIAVDKYHKMESFGTVYIETQQKYNWFQAWNECAIRNMTLITVDTAGKSAALTTLLRNNAMKCNLYLGGHDLGEEGRFIWALTGKPFDFSNWSKGNPDNNKDVEDCAHIWDITDFEWNDTRCENKLGFMYMRRESIFGGISSRFGNEKKFN